MDTLPDLLSKTVGDATVIDTVDIGGGDAVAVTNRATHVYRSDGLLSDESVETFGHDIDRLSIQTKRRKSKIRLETIDNETDFTVPSKIADPIVEAMIEGVLRTTDVIEADEGIVAQFRFSELTLIVTDARLFEHVGSAVWDEDFEVVEFSDLTGLDFEKGSVATQVVIETEARRRRVKVPNEHAGRVQRVIQEAVFEFYDVSSIKMLREELAKPAAEETGSKPDSTVGGDQVSGDRSPIEQSQTASEDPESGVESDGFVSAGWDAPADQEVAGSTSWGTELGKDEPAESKVDASGSTQDGSGGRPSETDIDELASKVETLSERIESQTERIESQRELIEQLVDELRRGR